MPKNAKPSSGSGRRSGTGKRSAPTSTGMKFFAAGCAVEIFLLAVRRFYVNGTLNQVVAWYDYLPYIGYAGLALAVLAGIGCYAARKNPGLMTTAAAVCTAGAVAAAASFLARWNQSAVSLLCVVVPAAMLICVFWSLYDRPCALSLTILGISLVDVWTCSRTAYQSSPYLSTIRTVSMIYMAVLVVGALLLWRGKLNRLLPPRADPLPVYAACALSAAALVPSLLNATAAYYAMWTLALIAFGLVVYYTVKQL